MRIKRTFAPTMREALQQVKLEQGGDAVILGNKKVPGGVEIISAIDFDESAFASMSARAPAPRRQATAVSEVAHKVDEIADPLVEAMMNDGRREPILGTVASSPRKARPKPTSAPVTGQPQVASNAPRSVAQPARRAAVSKPVARAAAKPGHAPEQKTIARTAVKAQQLPVQKTAVTIAQAVPGKSKPPAIKRKPVEAVATQEQVRRRAEKPAIEGVRIELRNLRDLMESQLSVLQWDRFSQKHPVRMVLLNLMSEMGLGADVCETVMSHLNQLNDDPHKVWQEALGIIARCIPIHRRDLLAEGGRIALVGSTGVGKTTTIAKLAARFAHTHGKRSVAMISTDHFRIGAQEQLQHFARLLEVPLLTAGNSEELCDRLEMLSDKKLVLIDTAGMSQRDLRLSEQFHELQLGSPEIRPYLVLSANTQLAALNQSILSFNKVRLAGAFVTKLDEAASLGGVITASIRHQLDLAYFGTGQKVPEDLEPAKSHRLLSKAVSMMQRYGEHCDQEALAWRYNHIINKNQA